MNKPGNFTMLEANRSQGKSRELQLAAPSQHLALWGAGRGVSMVPSETLHGFQVWTES